MISAKEVNKKFLVIIFSLVLIVIVVMLSGYQVNAAKTKDGWVLKKLDDRVYARYEGKAKSTMVPDGVYGVEYLSASVEEIHLSASVRNIDPSIEKYLEKYSVSEENKKLCAKDGVLFSKNMKRLISYPSQKSKRAYRVPPGVVATTGYIQNDNLKSFTLPNSMKDFGGISSKSLVKLRISKNVKGVGIMNSDTVYTGYNLTWKVYLPKLKVIAVDKSNKYYSSKNGVLYNKEKTWLLHYPSSKTAKRFKMPSSVQHIARGAFGDNKYLKELILSKNLKELKEDAIYSKKLKELHIPQNVESAYISWNMPNLKKITLDEKNPNLKLIDGILYNYDVTEICCFPAKKKVTSYNIPETVKGYVGVRIANKYVEDLYFHSDFVIFGEDPYEDYFENSENFRDYSEHGWRSWTTFPPNLKNIHVDNNNQFYTSIDGVLFNKTKTNLIYYPSGRTASSYTVPSSVKRIEDLAFDNVKKKLTVKLPSKVKYIANTSRDMFGQNEEEYYANLLKLYKKITFKVPKGSRSYKTVKKAKLKYKF